MKVKSSHVRVRSVIINIETINGSNVCPFTEASWDLPGKEKGTLVFLWEPGALHLLETCGVSLLGPFVF